MKNYFITRDQLIYNNFYIIDYSKKLLNKISIFDINNNFYGDYNTIMEAKNLLNKNLLTKF